jgi:hypothetical protein
LYQPFLLIAEKRTAPAPNLQLLQMAKVSHENLTLKSIFFEKFSKTKNILRLQMTGKKFSTR